MVCFSSVCKKTDLVVYTNIKELNNEFVCDTLIHFYQIPALQTIKGYISLIAGQTPSKLIYTIPNNACALVYMRQADTNTAVLKCKLMSLQENVDKNLKNKTGF